MDHERVMAAWKGRATLDQERPRRRALCANSGGEPTRPAAFSKIAMNGDLHLIPTGTGNNRADAYHYGRWTNDAGSPRD